jgi:hypothetical protein
VLQFPYTPGDQRGDVHSTLHRSSVYVARLHVNTRELRVHCMKEHDEVPSEERIVATEEQPGIVSDKEQPNVLSDTEQPDVPSDTEQPDILSDTEQPDIRSDKEQPDILSAEVS